MRELTSWNEKTYNEVSEFFTKSNSAAIINATGTGKTSIIAKVVKDYVELGKIMIVAPRESILNQYNKVEYDIFDYQNIDMMSYQMLSSLYKKKTFNLAGYSLIVFDELHRTGAKIWGAAILELKELNPNSKFLGATATPRRYDQKDQIEDMVDILFEGNRAGNYDLVECLQNGILPIPTYVSTLYSMKEEISLRNETVNTIKDEEVKRNMLFALREVEINWEKSHSVVKTLNTFLGCLLTPEKNVKILIFCKNKQHIREIKDVFDPIFKRIFRNATDISISKYHNSTGEIPFLNFRDRFQKNSVQILYSIDKFNEGVHVDSLDAIIMLRETMSEIVYYQQVGRVLSIGGTKHPLIIDFVNNFKSVKNYDVWNKVMSEKDKMPSSSEEFEEIRGKKVFFYNLIKDPIALFEEIDLKLRDIKMYDYNGEQNTLKYFSEKYKKNYSELYKKIKDNMSMKEAIETSEDFIQDSIDYEGQSYTLIELCSKLSKNYQLVKYRIDHGKIVEEALR